MSSLIRSGSRRASIPYTLTSPLSGLAQALYYLNRSRLAGSVWTENPEYLAFLNAKAYPIHSSQIAVPFAEGFDFYNVAHLSESFVCYQTVNGPVKVTALHCDLRRRYESIPAQARTGDTAVADICVLAGVMLAQTVWSAVVVLWGKDC